MTNVRMAIARVRAMAGLPATDCDAAATSAAMGHCAYVEANGKIITHVETPGRPLFLGVNFWNRLEHEKFRGDPGTEVMSNVTGSHAVEDARGWMNSVYHRAAFLRAENDKFGYGHAADCAVIDFGKTKGASVKQPRVIWPPPGAINVPPQFWSSKETPNPLPGTTVVGSPISIITSDSLAGLKATLVGPSGTVATTLITSKNDPTKLVHGGEAHLVPKSPLLPNALHRAQFTYEANDKKVVLSTSFTTGAAQ